MGNLNYTFSADHIDTSYELLPAGSYIAQIIDSEIKQNNSGTGNRLSLRFEIVEGDKAGRIIFNDITLQNQNAAAEKIGRSQMAKMTQAIGKLNVSDSSELHHIPLQIRVGIREDKNGQYGPQNVIKDFLPAKGGQPVFGTQQQQTTTPHQSSAKPANSAPWARG